jgi:N-acyl-D-amino-acid deacylase
MRVDEFKYTWTAEIENGVVQKGDIGGFSGFMFTDSGGVITFNLYTNYDAQLNWDPYASMSGWFGVTSISIGQCGFGFAPTRPEDRELNMRLMNRIEAIPLRSMQLGMRWDWETFPEYLDSLDRQGLGVNVGALLPFSPLRGYVLGMQAARQRTSMTEAELQRMQQLLYEAMQAGAFGFSADQNLEDRTEDGSALLKHFSPILLSKPFCYNRQAPT